MSSVKKLYPVDEVLATNGSGEKCQNVFLKHFAATSEMSAEDFAGAHVYAVGASQLSPMSFAKSALKIIKKNIDFTNYALTFCKANFTISPCKKT